jgi:hypothetical protein
MRRPRCLRIASALAGLTVFSQALTAGEPAAAALTTFKAHIRETEGRLDALLQNKDAFLWADTAARRAKLQAGEVVCVPSFGQGSLDAQGALIHHWVGAVFIPGVPVDRVLALVQNYDNHKNTYAPHVIASHGERSGNDFRVSLRLQERALWVTVVLDTEYDVHYHALAGGDWRSNSSSRKIVEVAGVGRRDERELTVREGHGYLWQLNSYWLFRGRDGGTYVECEAVSLSRGIPAAAKILAPVFRPFISKLPRNSLDHTLRATRDLALTNRR